uniref:Borealin N-terminal domain-containing protein n=1 Tax=Gadus morhua TaxID=8049 RepID=A0A8C5CY12_GADMO
MSPRRTRSQKFRDSSQVPEQEAAELRNNRFTLFIQQYEKEAHERISEMEARMDNMLKTVDKFFKVELMKMPPSLQRTLIGDLIDRKLHAVISASFLLIQTNSPEIQRPLKRTSSRKGDAVVCRATLRNAGRTFNDLSVQDKLSFCFSILRSEFPR